MARQNLLQSYAKAKPRAYRGVTIAIETYETIKMLSEELNTTLSGTIEALINFYESNVPITPEPKDVKPPPPTTRSRSRRKN